MSIPANNIVNVLPGVLSAGGTGLTLNGLILSDNTTLPAGAPVSFANALAVSNYFGAGAPETAMAAVYFAGYTNGAATPSSLLFARYVETGGAFLRGGALTKTLAQLNALIPAVGTASIAATTMTVTAVSSGAYAAGQLLTGAGVNAGTRIVAQLTGSAGSTGTYSVDSSQTVASTSITGAYDLTVTIDGVAKTAASLNLSAAASFSAVATALASALTLSGGQTCTYSSQFGAFTISSGTTGASSTITVGSGAAAAALGLTLATGAVLSQGVTGGTPTSTMNSVIGFTENWATFTTAFEPSDANKLLFSNWTSAQDGQFAYVCWDTSAVPAATPNSTTCFGYTLAHSGNSGTMLIGANTALSANLAAVAAFAVGIGASLNFDKTNGRITYAFKSSAACSPTVSDATSAANLLGNGYNFYGDYATAQEDFIFLYPGKVSGPSVFMDAYVNAIWLNAQLQLAIMVGFTNTPSVPYNNAGYSLIGAWAADPAKAAVNFGAIRAGVTLSAAQIAEVNQAAGVDIDKALFAKGWYFQVTPATAQQRADRQSPACTLWYTDGGSVQQLNVSSIDIQ